MNESYWSRLRSPRVSRRGFLRSGAAAGAGLAGAALIGCGGDEDGAGGGATLGGAGTTAPSGAGTATGATNYPSPNELTSLSIDELRKTFQPENLADLPGHEEARKNGPTRGGVMKITGAPPTTGWDVFGVGGGSVLAATAPTHNTLLTWEWHGDMGPQGEHNPVTDLPQSMEQPDDTTIVFTLRDEPVYFQDVSEFYPDDPVKGRQLTVQDVVYSVERLAKGVAQATTWQDMESVEAVDERTVRINFREPAAYFMRSAAMPTNWIVAPEHADNEDGFGKWPIGTGAYKLTYQESQVRQTYARHERYWEKDPLYDSGQQLPFLDGIEETNFPDQATVEAAWASRQLHMPSLSFMPLRQFRSQLEQRPDGVVQMTTPPPSYQPYVAVNLNTPPFDDVRVRRALQMAVDRQTMIDGLFQGIAGPGYSQDWTFFERAENPWPWTLDELGPYMQYNPEEARKLLQAAGFERGLGRPIELAWAPYNEGPNVQIWNAMVDYWTQELGVEVQISQPSDASGFHEKLYGMNYQDLNVAWPFTAWDPHDYAFGQLHSESSANFYTVSDPTIDELAEKQQRILDIDERRDVLRQIMDRDLDQAYRLWGLTMYKMLIRDPSLYNMSDHYLAWMPGWGEPKEHLVWIKA